MKKLNCVCREKEFMEIIDFHMYIYLKKNRVGILCFLEPGSWIGYIILSFDKDSSSGL